MIEFCQHCGLETKLGPPRNTNYKYSERRVKWRKPYGKKYEIVEPVFIKGNWVNMVTKEWIAFAGQKNYYGKCKCGKMVFGHSIPTPPENIPAPRSIRKNKVITPSLTEMVTFTIGEHWYKFKRPNIIKPIQTNLFE